MQKLAALTFSQTLIPAKALVLAVTVILAGCSFPGVYKINVQQGNIVTQEDLDQLAEGMTRRQVHSILGSPAVISPVDSSREYYIYTYQRADKAIKQQRVIVYYDNEQYSRYEAELLPNTPAY